MVGKLVGRMVGRMMGRMVGRMLGMMLGRIVGRMFGRMMGMMVGRMVCNTKVQRDSVKRYIGWWVKLFSLCTVIALNKYGPKYYVSPYFAWDVHARFYL